MAVRRRRTKMLKMLLEEIGPYNLMSFNKVKKEVVDYHCPDLEIVKQVLAEEQLLKDYNSLISTLDDNNICFHPSLKTQQ